MGFLEFLVSTVLIMPGVAQGSSPSPGLHYFFPDSTSVQEFKINVDKSFVDLTLQKVRNYRPATSFSDDWDIEGPSTQTMQDVAEYWSNEYDWDAVQTRINNDFKHYAVTVPGSGNYTQNIPLHFVHERSEKSDAMPLLVLHGWPSSYLEWSKVIKPLTEGSEQPFHIVAPDLPGFGFSPAPKQRGLGPRELGKAFDALMKKLGYDKYGIVTTDLGWFTGMWMVNDVHDSIIGHMTDFYLAAPTDDDQARLAENRVRPDEKAYIEAYQEWFQNHWLYANAHMQKPLTLSHALGDSPVGLLGWYWDVNQATSDGYKYEFEQLITDAMMLWIPGPYSNVRAYREIFQPHLLNFPKTNVPSGVSEWGWNNGPFPKIHELAFTPRDWIERTVNLKYFRRHEGGGHFPAVTQPELWIEDVRQFFGLVSLEKRLYGERRSEKEL